MSMKHFYGIFLLTVFLYNCTGIGSGSHVVKSQAIGLLNDLEYSLAEAIEQSAEKVVGELPAGSRVAVVAFESENENISIYIMDELNGALFDRGFVVTDRQTLEYVHKELNFQMSGAVNDEDVKSVGKFLAADMVITGQLINVGGEYRYRLNAVNVEQATRASVIRLTIQNNKKLQQLIDALAKQSTGVKTAKYD